MPNYCKFCGGKTGPEVKFCPSCGAQVGGNTGDMNSISGMQPAYGESTQSAKKNHSDLSSWMPAVAVFMAIVLAGNVIMISIGRHNLREILSEGDEVTTGTSYTEEKGSEYSPEQDTKAYVGNSKAFKVEPVEGITLSAEENALDQDRTFNMAELSEGKINEYQDKLGEEVIVFDAYSMDSGMDESRYFPGTFQIDVDLEKLGIPEELHEAMTLYHADSKGRMNEYLTTLKDGHLYADSRENGALLVGGIITLTLVAGGSYWYETTERFDDLNGKRLSYYLTDELSGKRLFKIHYTPEDLMTANEKKVEFAELDLTKAKYKIYTPLFNQAVEKLKKEHPDWKIGKTQAEASVMAKRQMKERLENDENYKAAREKADSAKKAAGSEEKPPVLIAIEERLLHAYQYIREKDYKLPAYTIDVVLQLAGDAGNANHARYIGGDYLAVNIGSFDENDQNSLDDMQITLTHELFHISQYQYTKSFMNDSVKLLESMAVRLETEANPWMKSNGFINDETNLTEHDFFQTLCMPADLIDMSVEAAPHVGQGYTLYNFLNYLEVHSGRKIPLKTILESMEKYASYKSFSIVVKDAYGMDDNIFSQHWYEFCCQFASQIISVYKDTDNNKFSVEFLDKYSFPDVNLRENRITPAEVKQMHCSAGARNFIYAPSAGKRGDYALILDFKGTDRKDYPELKFIDPEGKLKPIDGGYYMPVSEGKKSILEIHDNIYSSGQRYIAGHGKTWSFGAIPMTAPGKPLVKKSEDGKDLLISIPEKSAAAKSGYVKGYQVKVLCSNGTEGEVFTGEEDFKTELKYPMDAATGGGDYDADDLSFSVTLREYLNPYKESETKLYGPESDAGDIEAENKEFEFIVVPTKVSLSSLSQGTDSVYDGTPEQLASKLGYDEGKGLRSLSTGWLLRKSDNDGYEIRLTLHGMQVPGTTYFLSSGAKGVPIKGQLNGKVFTGTGNVYDNVTGGKAENVTVTIDFENGTASAGGYEFKVYTDDAHLYNANGKMDGGYNGYRIDPMTGENYAEP